MELRHLPERRQEKGNTHAGAPPATASSGNQHDAPTSLDRGVFPALSQAHKLSSCELTLGSLEHSSGKLLSNPARLELHGLTPHLSGPLPLRASLQILHIPCSTACRMDHLKLEPGDRASPPIKTQASLLRSEGQDASSPPQIPFHSMYTAAV